jgi:hypothetical protein
MNSFNTEQRQSKWKIEIQIKEFDHTCWCERRNNWRLDEDRNWAAQFNVYKKGMKEREFGPLSPVICLSVKAKGQFISFLFAIRRVNLRVESRESRRDTQKSHRRVIAPLVRFQIKKTKCVQRSLQGLTKLLNCCLVFPMLGGHS